MLQGQIRNSYTVLAGLRKVSETKDKLPFKDKKIGEDIRNHRRDHRTMDKLRNRPNNEIEESI